MTVFNRLFSILDRYCHVYRDYQQDVLSLFEPDPGATLLDLGCGNGDFTLKIAARVGASRVYGVDISAENVARARAGGIDCRQSNLDEVGELFSDEAFDIVCANQVLEHLSDTDKLPGEIYRLLKPDGYAVIATPNLAATQNIFSLLLGFQPPQTAVSDDFDIFLTSRHLKKRTDPWPTHRRAFTLEGLQALLRWHGLSVVATKGSGLYPLPSVIARPVLRFEPRHAAYLSVKARKIQPEKRRAG
jgi:methionine biosynthesis protein MetW